jgi:hypothetical protein
MRRRGSLVEELPAFIVTEMSKLCERDGLRPQRGQLAVMLKGVFQELADRSYVAQHVNTILNKEIVVSHVKHVVLSFLI